MAQELAIAKAAFSASLFRADPTSLSRPQVESLFPLIDAAVTQCSRPNVQACKSWIITNVAPSSARVTSLGRYLVALAKSQNSSQATSKPSTKRRRLHILYIVSDVAHHIVAGDGSGERLSACWDLHLPALFASAASFQRAPKHRRRLEALVDLWEERAYFAADLLARLRAAIESGTSGVPTTEAASSLQLQIAKDPPYTLPSFHGDTSTPWYDLPAGTWFPHIRPNNTRPMRPEDIRPVRLNAGPADEKLVTAVKDLLTKVDRLYSKGSKWGSEPNVDVNMLGERIVRDEITGEIVDGDTYYGWSRAFCTQMKERKKRNKEKGRDSRPRSRSRTRSLSRSRSRDRSYSPRPSHSRASSRTSTRGRTQRPAYSRSRSPRRSASPPRGLGSHQPRTSRSRSRSRSPYHSRRNRSYSRSPSRSRSRSRDYRSRDPHPHPHQHHPPPPPPPPPQGPYSYPPHPPHQENPPFQQFPPPMPARGDYPPFPTPPPPPMGYNGNWPPPPPPPPHMGGQPPNTWFPPPPNRGGPGPWGPNPGYSAPPPPPPHPYGGGDEPRYTAGQYTRGNRGGGRGRGRGRGGYEHRDHSNYHNQGWR